MHKVIRARNVQEAYRVGLGYLRKHGQIDQSRNGPVYVAPGPVMTEYARPLERVIVDSRRDANPFFHLMESIWMLAGRNDVASLLPFNGRMELYSDDTVTFHGAYGYRWRNWFGYDQVCHVIYALRQDYATRRAVIQMWDGKEDGRGSGKDYPCNTALYFRTRDMPGTGRRYLDMTISNRSNDVIWGAYGANAVHMSVLHEFIAAQAGMEMGIMYQLSNNFHAYAEVLTKVGEPEKKASECYRKGSMKPTPLFRTCQHNPETVLAALDAWWRRDERGNWHDVLEAAMTVEGLRCINSTRAAWDAWKMKEPDLSKTQRLAKAQRFILGNQNGDWSWACHEWFMRRATASTNP